MADVKAYYLKIKQLEDTIQDPFTIIASVATSDGGKEGILTEVTRRQAAILITDGKARWANVEEVAAYRRALEDKAAEQERRARAQELQSALLADVLLKTRGDRGEEA